MKIVEIKVVPGIHTEQSPRGLRRKWKDGDKVRFRYNKPEKMKGWADYAELNFPAITSQPYSIQDIDSLRAATVSLDAAQVFQYPAEAVDAAQAEIIFGSSEDINLVYIKYSMQTEAVDADQAEIIAGAQTVVVYLDYTMQTEAVDAAQAEIIAGESDVILISYSMVTEGLDAAQASIVSGESS